jgi:hypothetical protein
LSLVTLHKTTKTSSDILVKSGEDHDLLQSHSYIYVGDL